MDYVIARDSTLDACATQAMRLIMRYSGRQSETAGAASLAATSVL
jgi:hypothetical protein